MVIILALGPKPSEVKAFILKMYQISPDNPDTLVDLNIPLTYTEPDSPPPSQLTYKERGKETERQTKEERERKRVKEKESERDRQKVKGERRGTCRLNACTHTCNLPTCKTAIKGGTQLVW